jgi:NAD(P)-dependent dehydrogenase (short-subunit alcohol dehydrogenase family)
VGLLDGKAILITGGARGIGAATAANCAVEGASVIICDLNEAQGAETARTINSRGGNASYMHSDIGDEKSVDNLFASIRSKYGRLDGAVNNAGIEVAPASTPDVSMADFDKIMRINLRGTFLCLREELRLMRESRCGSVVNISSVAGLDGINNSIVYNASKHAVVGMTKCAALDMGALGIRVNSVAPGATQTEMVDDYFKQIPRAREIVTKKIPMQRIARPNEIAEAVCWLLSDKSSFVSGHTVVVDGGMLAGRMYID